MHTKGGFFSNSRNRADRVKAFLLDFSRRAKHDGGGALAGQKGVRFRGHYLQPGRFATTAGAYARRH
jgi:hypothetical protein